MVRGAPAYLLWCETHGVHALSPKCDCAKFIGMDKAAGRQAIKVILTSGNEAEAGTSPLDAWVPGLSGNKTGVPGMLEIDEEKESLTFKITAAASDLHGIDGKAATFTFSAGGNPAPGHVQIRKMRFGVNEAGKYEVGMYAVDGSSSFFVQTEDQWDESGAEGLFGLVILEVASLAPPPATKSDESPAAVRHRVVVEGHGTNSFYRAPAFARLVDETKRADSVTTFPRAVRLALADEGEELKGVLAGPYNSARMVGGVTGWRIPVESPDVAGLLAFATRPCMSSVAPAMPWLTGRDRLPPAILRKVKPLELPLRGKAGRAAATADSGGRSASVTGGGGGGATTGRVAAATGGVQQKQAATGGGAGTRAGTGGHVATSTAAKAAVAGRADPDVDSALAHEGYPTERWGVAPPAGAPPGMANWSATDCHQNACLQAFFAASGARFGRERWQRALVDVGRARRHLPDRLRGLEAVTHRAAVIDGERARYPQQIDAAERIAEIAGAVRDGVSVGRGAVETLRKVAQKAGGVEAAGQQDAQETLSRLLTMLHEADPSSAACAATSGSAVAGTICCACGRGKRKKEDLKLVTTVTLPDKGVASTTATHAGAPAAGGAGAGAASNRASDAGVAAAVASGATDSSVSSAAAATAGPAGPGGESVGAVPAAAKAEGYSCTNQEAVPHLKAALGNAEKVIADVEAGTGEGPGAAVTQEVLDDLLILSLPARRQPDNAGAVQAPMWARGTDHVEQLLAHHFKHEEVELACDICKHPKALKWKLLGRLPDIWIMQLVRFRRVAGPGGVEWTEKDSRPVAIPGVLSAAGVCLPEVAVPQGGGDEAMAASTSWRRAAVRGARPDPAAAYRSQPLCVPRELLLGGEADDSRADAVAAVPVSRQAAKAEAVVGGDLAPIISRLARRRRLTERLRAEKAALVDAKAGGGAPLGGELKMAEDDPLNQRFRGVKGRLDALLSALQEEERAELAALLRANKAARDEYIAHCLAYIASRQPVAAAVEAKEAEEAAAAEAKEVAAAAPASAGAGSSAQAGSAPPELAAGVTDASYKLVAVVNHIGDRPKGGHYTAYVRARTGWACCNDDRVYSVELPVGGDSHVSRRAYMLFYVRREAAADADADAGGAAGAAGGTAPASSSAGAGLAALSVVAAAAMPVDGEPVEGGKPVPSQPPRAPSGSAGGAWAAAGSEIV